MILTLFGEFATKMALVSNRLPEVLDTGSWRSSHSHGEARRFLQVTKTDVRLRIDNRILLEDILKRSIPVGADLSALAAEAAETAEPGSPLMEALTIYQGITP